jgi:DNA end-binding protein Ku
MVEAKIKHRPIPQGEPARKLGKVISLMDALRQSVQGNKSPKVAQGPPVRISRGGLSLVKTAKSAKRRSA